MLRFWNGLVQTSATDELNLKVFPWEHCNGNNWRSDILQILKPSMLNLFMQISWHDCDIIMFYIWCTSLCTHVTILNNCCFFCWCSIYLYTKPNADFKWTNAKYSGLDSDPKSDRCILTEICFVITKTHKDKNNLQNEIHIFDLPNSHSS